MRAISRFFSRISVQVFIFNVMLVFLPAAAFLYLDIFEKQLLTSLEESLAGQGRTIAAALRFQDHSLAYSARTLLENMGREHLSRIRIIDTSGILLADSATITIDTSGDDTKQISNTEVAATGTGADLAAKDPEQDFLYKLAVVPVRWFRKYFGTPGTSLGTGEYYNNATVYNGIEIKEALAGRYGAVTRISSGGQISVNLYSAVPIFSGEDVIGVVLVSQSTYRILRNLYDLRLEILKIFLISLVLCVLISIWYYIKISRPLMLLNKWSRTIIDQRGHISGMIQFWNRGDEIGTLQRALSDLTKRLSDHINYVESFAQDMAHELKNPLASIRSAAELAYEVDDKAKRNEFLDMVQKEVLRLERLINGVREISSLDAKLSVEGAGPVWISTFIKEWVDRQTPVVQDNGAVFNLEISPGVLGTEVHIQSDRLSQVMDNLLDNALSFSPPGSVIFIRINAVHKTVEIEFEDQGPGVLPENRDRIFNRFFSWRDAKSKGQHNGLGLSIVRTILRNAGGDILLKETGRQGACFLIKLPLFEDFRHT
jgi:two-component system sensor histidine kinase ChvG